VVEVVAGIDDDTQRAGRHDPIQSEREFRAADAAG
jgi:hypothetical protein